jgi:hypothetical protein
MGVMKNTILGWVVAAAAGTMFIAYAVSAIAACVNNGQ